MAYQGNSQNNIFQPTMPKMNLSPFTMPNYTPNYGSDTKIGQLTGQYGQNLAPAQQFSQQLPYQQFADPFQESLNVWEKTFARPQFEQEQLNPWKQQYGAQAAAGGMSGLGGGKQRYQRGLIAAERPYQNQLMQAQQQMQDMVEGLYRGRMQQNYNQPGAFRA